MTRDCLGGLSSYTCILPSSPKAPREPRAAKTSLRASCTTGHDRGIIKNKKETKRGGGGEEHHPARPSKKKIRKAPLSSSVGRMVNLGKLPHAVAYTSAIVLYLVALYAPGIVAAKWPWAGCVPDVCDAVAEGQFELAATICTVLWMFHFLRRVGETVFLFSFKRKRDLNEAAAFLWYGAWAFWIGLSIRSIGTTSPGTALLVIGLVFFALGEFGNAYCHYILVNLRKTQVQQQSRSGHLIPHGFLFRWFVAPHYNCEALAWLGFAMCSFTLPSLIFVVVSVLAMAPRAIEADKKYKEEFGEDYTKLGRVVFIPGLK